MGNSATPAAGTALRSAGVVGQDWYATHVAIRLRDFFFEHTPWQRRLWDAGTVGALKELLDASRWRSERVLSDGSVSWFARELERIVGLDHGVGDRQSKKAVIDALVTGVPHDSREWRRLEQLVRRVESGYLERWTAALDTASPPGAERVARAVAAHLLDRGYSMPHLNGWVSRHIMDGSSLAALMNDAATLATQPIKKFQVLLPFEGLPTPRDVTIPSNWLSAPDVKSWLAARGGGAPGKRGSIRYAGAFLYEVSARDPYGASRIVAGVSDRLLARASYAPGYSRTRAHREVWVLDLDRHDVDGVPVFPLKSAHRGVYVRSLAREEKVHAVGIASTALDDALELAASLNNSSSPGPAIASGWSALESLLFAPADSADSKEGRGVVACDRAAALTVCAWPRSELTALSHRHKALTSVSSTWPVGELAASSDARSGGPTAASSQTLLTRLNARDSNLERCRLLLDAYASHQRLLLESASDVAAQERMLALAADPKRTLGEVRGQVQHAFRRMYRLRNIVVHGGAASSDGLEVALRTASPLVGVALDRVAHAQLVQHVPPLAIAARADVHLELAGSSEGPGLADLLE